MTLHLISCIGVDADLPYVPHFLKHYSDLGVEPGQMRIILQSLDADNPNLRRAIEMLESRGVVDPELWIAPYTSVTMWEQRRLLQQKVAQADDWVISADVDEFHDYPAPLHDIIAWCDEKGCDVVQGPFIDRVAEDLTLREIPGEETSIEEVYPVETDVRHSIGGFTPAISLGGSVKVMLCRGDVFPSTGGHGVIPEQRDRPHALGVRLFNFPDLKNHETRFALPFLVHHYKWTAGLEERMRKRLDTPGITEAGREYGEALLNFFDGSRDLSAVDLPIRDALKYDRSRWRETVADIRETAQKKSSRRRGGLVGKLRSWMGLQ